MCFGDCDSTYIMHTRMRCFVSHGKPGTTELKTFVSFFSFSGRLCFRQTRKYAQQANRALRPMQAQWNKVHLDSAICMMHRMKWTGICFQVENRRDFWNDNRHWMFHSSCFGRRRCEWTKRRRSRTIPLKRKDLHIIYMYVYNLFSAISRQNKMAQ